MRRRDLLAGVGGLLAAGAAGCLAEEDDGTAPGGRATNDTRTPEDPITETPRTGTPGDPTTGDPDGDPSGGADWGPGSEEPFETAAVGTREGVAFPENNGPHTVRVWNGASEARTIELTLRRGSGTALDRTVEFPADGWLELTLNEPASYELAVAVGGETAGTVALGRQWFDCNGSWTNVAVNAEGAVDSTSGSTMVACPGPSVAGQSFSVGEGRCGSGGEAAVAFADGAVRVTGTVTTPTPCYDLALASVELRNAEEYEDGTDDVLVVTVATDGTTDEVCTDCVGGVDYEATVDFEHDFPSNVRVVHDGAEGRRTVREVSR